MDIVKIDKNFAIKALDGKEFNFYPFSYEKFKIYGLPFYSTDKAFLRFPKKWYESTENESLKSLSECTSGVRIRFKTDSASLAIKAKIRSPHTSLIMTSIGGSGFDVYAEQNGENYFVGGKATAAFNTDVIDAVVTEKLDNNMKQITINFPLYNGVKDIEVGVSKNAVIEEPDDYKIEKPILFYGSSITQGGFATRPGLAYPAILSRWLNSDFINYGLSGSAKGEPEIAKIISSIDIKLFVMDYDYNANSLEHLRETHDPFFRIIREAKPDLPVVFISRPDTDRNPVTKKWRDVVYETYANALNSGDKNVYFIDGSTLFDKDDRDCCTVDGRHPNDLGFYRMAKNIYPVLKNALSQEK